MTRDICKEVTDKLIESMENNPGAWIKPWVTAGPGMPHNAVTGHEYNGINIPMLWGASAHFGHKTNGWASYQQWRQKGAQVRKGEKGTMIVFWSFIEKEEDGKKKKIGFLKCSHVFNADQVDGFDYQPPTLPNLAARLENAEAFFAATGADIRHGHSGAFYNPNSDFVAMPDREAFIATNGSSATETYYGTLAHEMTHWTGHAKRCDRQFGKRFGDHAYAFEELVAELGAAFLSAHLGISSEPRADHAQYLASWLRVLRKDSKAVLTAASKASEALTYLRGLQTDEQWQVA